MQITEEHELDDLKSRLSKATGELLDARLQLIESQIKSLEQSALDRELRLRVVEISRVRFETLAYFAFGGGALSILNLILQIFNIRL